MDERTALAALIAHRTEAECAYAGGLLDGEGSVIIRRRVHGSYEGIELRVTISNSCIPVLEWLRSRWGGAVNVAPRKNPNWKPEGQWILAARKATAFLLDVRRYLIIKTAQADNALALRALRRGRLPRSEAERRAAENLLLAQQRLNRRG